MKTEKSQGSITLMVLVMLLVFGLIFGTIAALISRQANQISDQEENEQVAGLADAGVQYAFWLLKISTQGGGITPESLCTNPPSGASEHMILDEQGVELGYFDLDFVSCSDEYVQVNSWGFDESKSDICQLIVAEFEKTQEGSFVRTGWNAKSGVDCPNN